MKKIQTNATRTPKGRKPLKPVRLIISIIIVFVFLSSGLQILKMRIQVSEEIARLNEQKTELLEEKKKLEEEIVRLNTPSYIEQLAREQLGLVKKGEIRIAPKKQ